MQGSFSLKFCIKEKKNTLISYSFSGSSSRLGEMLDIPLFASWLNCSLNNQLLGNGGQLTRSTLTVIEARIQCQNTFYSIAY